MQRIHFCSGTSFTTGDDIASALLEYAVAIARVQRFDLVHLPVDHDDAIGSVSLVLGPTSQISAESMVTARPELRDPELVHWLRSRTGAIVESPVDLVTWSEN